MVRMQDLDDLMYSCGLETLHPGGRDISDRTARMCGVAAGQKVLDVGSGKGGTACRLAKTYGCTVVGVDYSPQMVEYAQTKAKKCGLAGRVSFRTGNAHELPFEDASFDLVIAECVTTLLDREKAFVQFLRVTKSGGWVGDSEMIWRKEPTPELDAKIHGLWEGFSTMTLDGWKAFFESAGLAKVATADVSQSMGELEREMRKELGPSGVMMMAMKLMMRPDLWTALNEYRALTKTYGAYFGYGIIVGRKP